MSKAETILPTTIFANTLRVGDVVKPDRRRRAVVVKINDDGFVFRYIIHGRLSKGGPYVYPLNIDGKVDVFGTYAGDDLDVYLDAATEALLATTPADEIEARLAALDAKLPGDEPAGLGSKLGWDDSRAARSNDGAKTPRISRIVGGYDVLAIAMGLHGPKPATNGRGYFPPAPVVEAPAPKATNGAKIRKPSNGHFLRIAKAVGTAGSVVLGPGVEGNRSRAISVNVDLGEAGTAVVWLNDRGFARAAEGLGEKWGRGGYKSGGEMLADFLDAVAKAAAKAPAKA